MSERKKVSTNFHYPYPAEPEKWGQEERRFSQGLRQLFDILFARKVQNVLIADNAITSRNIKSKSIGLSHLADGFGASLDITENTTITDIQSNVETAQSTADDAAEAASAAQITADDAAAAASAAQSTADDAAESASSAQSTADGIPSIIYPVGIIIIKSTAPSFGTWEEVDIGLQNATAWQRTA